METFLTALLALWGAAFLAYVTYPAVEPTWQFIRFGRRPKRPSYGEIKAKQADLVRAAMHTDYRTPDHQIRAWTPEEREAFGINDTQRFIDATQRILDDIGHERRAEQIVSEWIDDPGAVAVARTTSNYEAFKARQAEIRKRQFDESPTVTGGRVFG